MNYIWHRFSETDTAPNHIDEIKWNIFGGCIVDCINNLYVLLERDKRDRGYCKEN